MVVPASKGRRAMIMADVPAKRKRALPPPSTSQGDSAHFCQAVVLNEAWSRLLAWQDREADDVSKRSSSARLLCKHALATNLLQTDVRQRTECSLVACMHVLCCFMSMKFSSLPSVQTAHPYTSVKTNLSSNVPAIKISKRFLQRVTSSAFYSTGTSVDLELWSGGSMFGSDEWQWQR
jgi:hypothetical protein